MKEQIDIVRARASASAHNNDTVGNRRFFLIAGWFGVAIAAPFFLWLPLGILGVVPSMIDVFGVVGMRIPASVTIAGLLSAAVGFHQN
ncbi:MAG: hypothetical protein P8P54_04090 [Pseudomonadales bacterium]|nr:hypothetical protein [Pseudomonadales bacterium]MDG1303323.1 hypothetical protein [Pseudomonadales bacterium]MDG1834430.1 hypothetical protein [Pseudomonadales bacterium]MDG1907689.1 hypothetical protein [Pseudomonadales bacterium]